MLYIIIIVVVYPMPDQTYLTIKFRTNLFNVEFDECCHIIRIWYEYEM